ncbi:DoxX family protein [Dokdonia sp.]|uniref:DoxX family protein n=1 Tax=Dokdonia sp. TaxID=2024995 RepID=UPI0032644B86
MSKNSDLGLLVLRVGVSGLMLTHGFPKLLKLLQGDFDFADPIGLGGMITLILTVIAEAICPVLIIVGIKTRLATIPPIIAMGVAAFVVHAADPIATKEKALLYLVAFIAIGLMGAGKLSLDRK